MTKAPERQPEHESDYHNNPGYGYGGHAGGGHTVPNSGGGLY
jgi:hypothetical protein